MLSSGEKKNSKIIKTQIIGSCTILIYFCCSLVICSLIHILTSTKHLAESTICLNKKEKAAGPPENMGTSAELN